MSSLRALDLAQNNLGDDGAKALAGTMTLNGLKYLDVFGNGISEDGQNLLKNAEAFSGIQELILT